MELDHEFTVPVPVDRAWSVLLDVERVALCMPGATLDSVDGEEYAGRLKVKVGAMTVTYRGTARIVAADESARTVTIEAAAKEARGPGTASATVQARLHDGDGGTTRVTVHTKLNVTGRPAQFGRNILSEVGAKLITRFAKALAQEIESPAAAPEIEPKPAPRIEAKPDAPAALAEPPAAPPAAEAEAVSPVERVEPPEPVEPVKPVPSVPQQRPASSVESTASDAEREPKKPEPKAEAASAAAPSAPVTPLRRREDDDAIDLLEVAGPSVAKRAVPAVGAVVLFLLAVRFLVRRRRRR
ncbi:SRPBCC family protein [Actinomadura yumaensis]|uniref:SRPBCC family protein n=2 Tax=Actinomadura TaxID=1988 RepID=A0ABW2CR90_9ACTN|nr:hypothetical protein [Actinomadura sp. J1-007]